MNVSIDNIKKEILEREFLNGNDFSKQIEKITYYKGLEYIWRKQIPFQPFFAQASFVATYFRLTDNAEHIRTALLFIDNDLDLEQYLSAGFDYDQLKEIFNSMNI